MTNAYATSTDTFQDISEGDYSSTDYPQMDGFLAAASRLIDREFGKPPGFFYPTTDTVTFYYDGSGETKQPIDSFVSLSNVYVAEQGGQSSSDYTEWTSGTDFITRPTNAAAKGMPITLIEIAQTPTGAKFIFPSYQNAVKVIGIPGYSATPPDLIAQACKIQAIRLFMRSKQAFQDSNISVEIGGMVIKGQSDLDPDVKAMLWPFKLEFSV